MPSTCTRLCSGEAGAAAGRGGAARVGAHAACACRRRAPTQRLARRGLLTERAAPVMNVIRSLFSLVLKFRSQLMSRPWGPVGPRGAEHPNFALMQQSYSAFKYYSHFLFKGDAPGAGRAGRARAGRVLTGPPSPPPVVTKLVNRGYQPHLEDFLLRINFNNYYQDA